MPVEWKVSKHQKSENKYIPTWAAKAPHFGKDVNRLWQLKSGYYFLPAEERMDKLQKIMYEVASSMMRARDQKLAHSSRDIVTICSALIVTLCHI